MHMLHDLVQSFLRATVSLELAEVSIKNMHALLKIWCWHNTFWGVNMSFKYNTPKCVMESVG